MAYGSKDMNAEEATRNILAYLLVLNHKPIIGRLTSEEYAAGSGNIMGCLFKVQDYARAKDWREVELLISYREKLNGYLPVGDSKLDAATAAVSQCLFDILRVQRNPVCYSTSKVYSSDPLQNEFLDKLDQEFSKILGRQHAGIDG